MLLLPCEPLLRVLLPWRLPCPPVPKKKMSRTKSKIRRALWKAQARDEALRALSLAQAVLSGSSRSFVYVTGGKEGKGEGEREGEEQSDGQGAQ